MGLPFNIGWQGVFKIVALGSVILVANILSDFIAEQLQFELRPGNEDSVHRMIMMSAFIYGVLIAIPFVPGVEIGLGLIAMLGPPIVFLVYVTTVAGLTLSYAVGHLVPKKVLAGLLRNMRAHSASRLVQDIGHMTRPERLAFLVAKAPNRIVPFLLRNRYFALVIAINLPGNFLIGGGGGIAMMAGASGLFSFPGFVFAIALAVSPIPLSVVLFSSEFYRICSSVL